MAKARFVVCCPGKLGTGDEVESNTRSMQGPQKEHRLICSPLHCGKPLFGKCPVLATFPMSYISEEKQVGQSTARMPQCCWSTGIALSCTQERATAKYSVMEECKED